jgi:hypothetical protein
MSECNIRGCRNLETVCKDCGRVICTKTLPQEIQIQEEWGSSHPISFAKATLCDAEGNDMQIKCKCGNEATSVVMGKESYMGLCNKCQYGE